MAKPADRMRLKDRIIDNISKAIKGIQEQLYYHQKSAAASGGSENVYDSDFTLRNGDRACHKLCENLDHTLLHGLKNVTHGYWRVVKQLSHKGMVKEIDYLINVTTDLGRGRAWLYASLNEGLLESYIRLLGDNVKLVKKYYAKEALLLDSDRMNVLLTLVSGLDFVTFHLDYDMPYLDLSAIPPRSRITSEPEMDVGSSMRSVLRSESFRSSSEMMASSVDSTSFLPSDSDSVSTASLDVSQTEPGMKVSMVSEDSGCPAENAGYGNFAQSTIRQRSITPTHRECSTTPTDTVSISSISSTGDPDRHQRLENIVKGNDEADNTEDSLEVIRIVKNRKGSKGKKKKNPSSTKKETGIESVASNNVDNCISSAPKLDSCHEFNLSHRTSHVESENSTIATSRLPQFDSGVDICDMAGQRDDSDTQIKPYSDRSSPENSVTNHSNVVSDRVSPFENDIKHRSNSVCDSVSPLEHVIKHRSNSVCEDTGLVCHTSALAEIESKIAELCNIKPMRSSLCELACEDNGTTLLGDSQGCEQDSIDQAFNRHSRSNSQKFNDDVSYSSQPSEVTDGCETDSKHTYDEEEEFDFYSNNNGNDMTDSDRHKQTTSEMTPRQESSQLQDYMDYIMKSSESSDVVDSPAETDVKVEEPDLFLNLDNNTKLLIMLEIFTQEDEHFVKMFVTRENHTEGEIQPIFVLISDVCLYLLRYKRESRKFILHSMAKLTDLIFISTGLNEQTMNIESRESKRQKQRFWLTPGYQAMTQSIQTCLTEAVRAANENVSSLTSRFSVGSEVPLQKIALRKYISRELNCEAQDVTIDDYSLVFWEDPESHTPSTSDDLSREGTLLLCCKDAFKSNTWKPVYCRLRNNMLCVYNNKSDPRPTWYLALGGDQCVGCRVTTVADRQYCLELILSNAPSWILSAATETEISEWRHSFCLAVSSGVEPQKAVAKSVTACCLVLASGSLFLCHEDLQTRFYRTLGRAKLEDVTAIATDDHSTYCIVEFESQESGVESEQWIFYFASNQDLQRHCQALGRAWEDVFKVDLPILPMDNVSLKQFCENHSQQLLSTFSL